MRKVKGKLNAAMSLLMAAVLCVQYLPVAVTAEAADTPMRITPSTYADTGYFGNGSDGDLHIKNGETVTLPVDIPHQSIVIKNYKSINIEVGGVLTTSDPNAGLILKVQGDVTVNGTIDQSAKAPKTNSSNAYPYPIEIQCGYGGAGADAFMSTGGKSMPARKYGGGYGGGGAGSGRNGMRSYNGGDSDKITVNTPAIFLGGSGRYWVGETDVNGTPGSFGGGGGGDGSSAVGGNYAGAAGGSGGLGGGGAGNMGGGILLLYASGAVSIPGNILCNGGAGGTGGSSLASTARGSGGGGGGGGGSIYIEYGRLNSITGNINVSGGVGGKGGNCTSSSGMDGTSGTDGKFTIKKAADSMPPVISAVTVSTSWGLTNTATIVATDDVSGIVSYAVTGSSAAPGNGSWQSGNSFTLSSNGTYYAWSLDRIGNTSAGYSFTVSKVDDTAPVVTAATVTPTGWTSGNKTITVTATDGQSGIAEYGITTTNTVPTTWQSGNTFSKPTGTYYVWAKDNVGRVSSSRQAAVDNIDTTAPVVTVAVVTPTGWTSGNKTITVTATDGQSGIAEYGITTTSTAPTAWQSGNTFSKAAGTYYVWAKDRVGNASAYKQVAVESLDDVKPVISGVTLSENWGQTNTATVNASDVGSSVNIYAISDVNTVPGDGWQSERSFILTENGTHYAWCKDKAGNISDVFSFEVSKVDTEVPIIIDVLITPEGWATNGIKTITVTATDRQSGIAQNGYAITTIPTAPTTM